MSLLPHHLKRQIGAYCTLLKFCNSTFMWKWINSTRSLTCCPFPFPQYQDFPQMHRSALLDDTVEDVRMPPYVLRLRARRWTQVDRKQDNAATSLRPAAHNEVLRVPTGDKRTTRGASSRGYPGLSCWQWIKIDGDRLEVLPKVLVFFLSHL